MNRKNRAIFETAQIKCTWCAMSNHFGTIFDSGFLFFFSTVQVKKWLLHQLPPQLNHFQSSQISEQCFQQAGMALILFLSSGDQNHQMLLRPPTPPFPLSNSASIHLPHVSMDLLLAILLPRHICSNSCFLPQELGICLPCSPLYFCPPCSMILLFLL